MVKRNPVTRDSDGVTIRLDKEEAEQAETSARAKRVILVDTTGTSISSANKLPVSTTPHFFEIAKGNISGSTSLNKFGHNSSVGASLEQIWDYGGSYTYLADDTFSTMYISSDDAADQSITYKVIGIDSDYNYSTISVTTDASNGRVFVALTSGATDNKWWRIVRVINTSSTVATGNVYVSKDNTDVGGNGIPDNTNDIQAQIKIGMEQTLMAQWTVPTGNTAHLTCYYASTSTNKVSEVHLYVKPFGGVFNIKHIITINQGAYHHNFDFPILIPAKSDIKIMASAVGGGGEVSAGFDLVFVNN